MGTLSLPSSGLVYIDAQAAIYSVERHADFGPLLEPLWRAVQSGRLRATTSELSVLETLVLPIRRGDQTLIDAFDAFFDDPGLEVVPVSRSVLRAAAGLRASSKLKTPDSIHWATAVAAGASLFVTNDADFRTLSGVPIVVLSDLLQA